MAGRWKEVGGRLFIKKNREVFNLQTVKMLIKLGYPEQVSFVFEFRYFSRLGIVFLLCLILIVFFLSKDHNAGYHSSLQ